jgi:hypothetical protein
MPNNYDTAKGFQPYEKLLGAHYYAILYSTVMNFFHGDIVGLSGNNLETKKMGWLPGLYTTGNIDGKSNLVGSVLALHDYNFDPVKYIAATDAGNGVIAGYALVADDPNQMFVGLEDLSTAAIDTADGSANADIVSRAISVGNTDTGLSHQMIQSSSIHTNVLDLKLYGAHPSDGHLVGVDTASPVVPGCRWICKIAQHFYWATAVTGGASA